MKSILATILCLSTVVSAHAFECVKTREASVRESLNRMAEPRVVEAIYELRAANGDLRDTKATEEACLRSALTCNSVVTNVNFFLLAA